MRWIVNNIGLIGAAICFLDAAYLYITRRQHYGVVIVLAVIGVVNLGAWAWRRGKPEWR
jgi:hypothetical protein